MSGSGSDFGLGSRSQDKGKDSKGEMKLYFIEKAKQSGQFDNNETVVVQSGPALNVIGVTLESKESDGMGLERPLCGQSNLDTHTPVPGKRPSLHYVLLCGRYDTIPSDLFLRRLYSGF